MMHEETKYQVICDEPGCCDVGGEAESASVARRFAREDGFVVRDGRDYCSRHATVPAPPPASKAKKRGRS